MLVVMAVLGLLATAAMPAAELVAKRGKERELKQALAEIRDALDNYKLAAQDGRLDRGAPASGYPPSLEVLTAGFVDQKTGKTVYLLKAFAERPVCAEQRDCCADMGATVVMHRRQSIRSPARTYLMCTRTLPARGLMAPYRSGNRHEYMLPRLYLN
jgi:type II secretory pathway pseudopilin PulG